MQKGFSDAEERDNLMLTNQRSLLEGQEKTDETIKKAHEETRKEMTRQNDEIRYDLTERFCRLDLRIDDLNQHISDEGGQTRERIAEVRHAITEESSKREAQISRLTHMLTNKIEEFVVGYHNPHDGILYWDAAKSMTDHLKKLQHTLNEMSGQNKDGNVTIQRHLNDLSCRLSAIEEMMKSNETNTDDHAQNGLLNFTV